MSAERAKTDVPLPGDKHAEERVLAALLAHPEEAVAIVREAGLRHDEFVSPALAAGFRTAMDLAAKGRTPDLLGVVDVLEKHVGLDDARQRIIAELGDIASQPGTMADLMLYVQTIRDLARRREAILLAETRAQAWRSPNGTAFGEEITSFEADLREIADSLDHVRPEPRLRFVAPPLDWMKNAPPARRWLIRHPDKDGKPCAPGAGDGVLPRGITGIVAGEGGSSKTMSLLQLAVCTVTGRPWFGHFEADRDVLFSKARVCLALGEEDVEEVQRRLYEVARVLDLDERERLAVHERLRIAGLSGIDVGLLAADKDSALRRTAVADELATFLTTEAGPDGWALVALDPLSRWAGADIEGDNGLATRWIEILEEIAKDAPGRPAVLVAAHSSKLARRAGDVDSRGVTALTDGARWFLTLRSTEDGFTEVAQAKSNYSRPWKKPVTAKKVGKGVLVALEGDAFDILETAAQRREKARDEDRAKQAEQDIRTILAVLDESGGEIASQNALVALVRPRGVPRDRARDAVRVALARGLILASGETSDRRLTRATEGGKEPLERACADSGGSCADPGAACARQGSPLGGDPAAQEADLFQPSLAGEEAAQAEDGEEGTPGTADAGEEGAR